MPELSSAYSRTFTVTERHELETILDREAAAAIEAAVRLGTGVAVTRHDARTFTVEASREVPPGIIHERDLFN